MGPSLDMPLRQVLTFNGSVFYKEPHGSAQTVQDLLIKTIQQNPSPTHMYYFRDSDGGKEALNFSNVMSEPSSCLPMEMLLVRTEHSVQTMIPIYKETAPGEIWERVMAHVRNKRDVLERAFGPDVHKDYYLLRH